MIESSSNAGHFHAILRDRNERMSAELRKESVDESIVRDQAEKECLSYGGHVVVTNVESRDHGWDVICVIWRNDGIGVEEHRKITIPDYAERTEEHMREAVTTSLKSFLKKQRKIAERLGLRAARITTEDEIDLSSYMIEKPLLALLVQLSKKDTDKYLKSKILRKYHANDLNFNHDLQKFGVENFSVELNQKALVCSFNTKTGDTIFRWARGSLFVGGHDFPDQVVIAMRGRQLGEILQHPVFDPEMTITAVDRTRREGVDGITFNLKDTTEEIPSKW